jgi:hypothetical protein
MGPPFTCPEAPVEGGRGDTLFIIDEGPDLCLLVGESSDFASSFLPSESLLLLTLLMLPLLQAMPALATTGEGDPSRGVPPSSLDTSTTSSPPSLLSPSVSVSLVVLGFFFLGPLC